jgi:hypothetical protein
MFTNLGSRAGRKRADGGLKMRDVVSAADFGLVGDGSDETTTLQQFLTAAVGKEAHFEPNKTYAYNPTTGLTIPAGTILRTHGSTFVKLSASTTYTFTIEGDTDIDRIELSVVGGFNEVGVQITGSNVILGEFICDAPVIQTGANASTYQALQIGDGTTAISNIRIGRLRSKDWDRPFTVQKATDVDIGFIDVDTFRRAVFVKDVINGRFRGAWIRTTSVTSIGSPGDNGVLIEATTANAAQNLWFYNWVVEDSGEHGYRCGGQAPMDAVYFVNCIARRPGSGTGEDHGGCGFKALGPTSTSNSINHTNINFINCIAEDGRTDQAATNFAGFHICKVYGGSLVNCQVRNSGQGSSTAFYNGIEIIGCQDIVISSPNLYRTAGSGIFIYDAASGGGVFWGDLQSRIHIVGGNIIGAGRYGIEAIAANITFRRITTSGVLIEPGTDAGDLALSATTSGSGAYLECQFDGTIRAGGATSLVSAADWLVSVRGRFAGTNACANGSTWADATNGAFLVRRSGAWETVAPSTYALIAGASGGQSIAGGTGVSDGLSLVATTGAGDNTEFIDLKTGTNGSERWMRLNGSGQFLFGGHTAAITTPFVTPGVQMAAASAAGSSFGGFRYGDNAFAPFWILAKSRNGTVGSHTIVQANDTLGTLAFLGSDGTAFLSGVQIAAEVDGTPGTNDMPGRIRFLTTADGAASPTERMRIDCKGNVVVNTAAIATTATDGFFYVPTCAGTPTGTPSTYTGRAPVVVDTTNNKLYFYSGGAWRDAGP